MRGDLLGHETGEDSKFTGGPMSHLRLVSSNSKSGLATRSDSLHKLRPPRAGSSACSPLQKKIAVLERTNPNGAAVVGRLVDDILNGHTAE